MIRAEDGKARIVIYDDNLTDRHQDYIYIEKYLKERGTEALVTEVGAQVEFRKYLQTEKPDIVLLEIHMAEKNGIEVARELRRDNQTAQIIFITNGNDYAAEAFEVEALGYLNKPVSYERFRDVMDKALLKSNLASSFTVHVDREEKRIFIRDILYVETLNRKIIIHTLQEDIRTYMSLAGIMKILPINSFVQISRFEIVQLSRIKDMNMQRVLLKDGSELTISPKMAQYVNDAYHAYRQRIGQKDQTDRRLRIS